MCPISRLYTHKRHKRSPQRGMMPVAQRILVDKLKQCKTRECHSFLHTHARMHTHTHTHTHLSPALGGMGGPAEATADGPWKETYTSEPPAPPAPWDDGMGMGGRMSASPESSLQTTRRGLRTLYMHMSQMFHVHLHGH